MPITKNDGVRIHWEEWGSGEPVLLIHGLSYSLDLWWRLIPSLAERYRVIAHDNRGVGGSDVPPGPYDLSTMAADAAAVLRAAGVERAHVIAASLGGMIGQHLALEHPALVRSLVLGCTACGGPDTVPRDPEIDAILLGRNEMDAAAAARA
ncbi:MAG TPA: alpha/beta fold hydrolase, partial [Actinomycetota bacterium]|nr:alpha/beta fold hydrolase [Actinomycetota bacterium]